MPSPREMFIGMTLLIVVGGYVTTRGGRSAGLTSLDTQTITAGVLTTPDELVKPGISIVKNEPALRVAEESLRASVPDDETRIGQ